MEIEKSRTLHRGFYNLMKKVWPKPEIFGQVCMAKCGPCWFRTIISIPDEIIWNSAYKSITNYLQSDPIKLEKLDIIYN